MATIKLNSLKPGQWAKIIGLYLGSGLKHRLYAFDFRDGQEIHLARPGWLAGTQRSRRDGETST